ncbi:enoyl-CoA hydratase-related protein [Paraburkholderia sp. RAU2J]|uniref:enoyl-CoA hydratase-related protein n=1 Tax=Paraburkholderia sp. RAU2J TaxID=1938810 RepID=UPI001F546A91|nr:enoyl-CoA hydratase-related protein [Paraburkholderia sp. RAU2J]
MVTSTYAIGGGNVLVTICDVAITSETAIFGQLGAKVRRLGSAVLTAWLALIVNKQRARSIW